MSVASYYKCFNIYDCSNLTVKTKPKINNSSKIKTKNSIMIIIKYTNIEFRSCFLRFYVLWWCARRVPLAKNCSWEFVYHINTLFVSPWKFKSSCITHLRHDSGFRTVWIVLARSYFKGLAGRDFLFRFSFSKSIAPSFW